MRLRTFIFGLAFSAIMVGSLCEVSWSQETPQGGAGGGARGGPGGGQRGGPGGFSTRGGGGRGGITSLIRIDEVQAELKLTDDQKKEIDTITGKMRDSMGFGGGGAPGGAPGGGDRQRGGRPGEGQQAGGQGGGRGPGGGPGGPGGQDQMNEMMARFTAARDKAEGEIMLVLDPDQQDRTLGLLIQLEDAGSLQSPSLRENLKITVDQQQKLKVVNDKSSADRIALFQNARGGGAPNDGMREQMEAMGKKTNSDLLAVLTTEQKAQYEALKGAKFTFPERQPGGPGGGTRGGGGDQNRQGGGGRPGRPTGPGTNN